MTEAEVIARMDVLVAIGAARRSISDPALQGLRPAETEWLERDELHELESLRLKLAAFRESLETIRARRDASRARRRAEMEKK